MSTHIWFSSFLLFDATLSRNWLFEIFILCEKIIYAVPNDFNNHAGIYKGHSESILFSVSA